MTKDSYIGLVFECPFQSELGNCPFSSIRQLEIKDKIDLYYAYPSEEFINMLQQHITCFTDRESKIFLHKPQNSFRA